MILSPDFQQFILKLQLHTGQLSFCLTTLCTTILLDLHHFIKGRYQSLIRRPVSYTHLTLPTILRV